MKIGLHKKGDIDRFTILHGEKARFQVIIGLHKKK